MFSENQSALSFDPEQVRKLLESPEGKNLLQLLSRDGGTALRQAAKLMKTGDLTAAQAAVSATMETPEAQELVRKINEKQGK